MSGGENLQSIAKGMTPAQRKWLAAICETNGGGERIACTLVDGEVVPSSGPLRKLFVKGLIQGKAGAYERVVHTALGLRVNRLIATAPVPA